MEKTVKQRAINILRLIAIFLLPLLGLYLLVELATQFMPFVLAIILAAIIRPLIRLLTDKWKFNRVLAVLIALLIEVALIVFLFSFAVSRLYYELITFLHEFPKSVFSLWTSVTNWLEQVASGSGLFSQQTIANIKSSAGNILLTFSNFGSGIGQWVYRTITSIPTTIIYIVMMLFSVFYIALDRDKISAFFKKQLSENVYNHIVAVRKDTFSALVAYLRTQLIMMGITFTGLIIGFLILGIPEILLISIVIAIVDALPIFGIGLFLIPWSAYSFITGNIFRGTGLLIMYLSLLIIRHTIEPRILSSHIQIHPLLTLISMFIGLELFGILGVILGPIILVVYKNIITKIMNGRTLKDMLE